MSIYTPNKIYILNNKIQKNININKSLCEVIDKNEGHDDIDQQQEPILEFTYIYSYGCRILLCNNNISMKECEKQFIK